MSLELCHRKYTSNWVARGTVRGIRFEKSTGTTDQKAAEEIKAKWEYELLTESIHGRRATATFASAALSYLQNGSGSKRFLDEPTKLFGTTPLAQINQDVIDRGARKVYPKASPATLNRQFYTPVSAVMTHAAEQGWCSKLLLRRPKIPKESEARWLTLEEADRLIAACSDHMRPLMVLLFYTGARCGEALWLDWRNVNFALGLVTFPKTKNGKPRSVPLCARLTAELANLPHRDGEVFRRPDGLPYERPRDDDDEDTSAGSRIKTAFKGACRRAGITNFHPHDCRHTWATWHYQANRDLGALRELGGWKSVKMVMRYAHVNVGELAHTIDRLPGGDSGRLENWGAKTA